MQTLTLRSFDSLILSPSESHRTPGQLGSGVLLYRRKSEPPEIGGWVLRGFLYTSIYPGAYRSVGKIWGVGSEVGCDNLLSFQGLGKPRIRTGNFLDPGFQVLDQD